MMYEILLGPQELARTWTYDPTDDLIDQLDGDHTEDDADVTPLTISALEPYLDRLPPVEADAVAMSLKGKRQTEIAAILGITQAAVSYRLSRAYERVRFFCSIPSLDADDVRDVITPIMDPLQVEIMMMIWQTSCQRKTARLLGISSPRVRYAVASCTQQLEDLATLDSFYRPYAVAFRMLWDHPNILHETEQPVWVGRRKAFEML